MFFFPFFCFSLQINQIFKRVHVDHIIAQRLSMPKVTVTDDIEELVLRGKIVPTKRPEHAILSLKSSRMHIFLLEESEIRDCLWDGCVAYEDKKSIMTNMLIWFKKVKKNYSKNKKITQNIIDVEDANVFQESMKQVKNGKKK